MAMHQDFHIQFVPGWIDAGSESKHFSRNMPGGSHETLQNVDATLKTDLKSLPNNGIIIDIDRL